MKTREKRSVIWKIEKEKLINVVKQCNTIKDILISFNLSSKGGNNKTLKKRLQYDNIDFSHITLGIGHNKGKKLNRVKMPLDEIMVENSTFSRCHIKKRILDENIIEEKCKICGSLPEWNNKKLVMVLDHINGISNDNRLENLRFLCPNCNSQQETFAGKNNRIDPSLRKREKDACPHCGEDKRIASKACYRCVRFSKSNIQKPTKEQLQQDLLTMNLTKIGKKYMVAHTTISRWTQSYELNF